jgi:hypothetical protein
LSVKNLEIPSVKDPKPPDPIRNPSLDTLNSDQFSRVINAIPMHSQGRFIDLGCSLDMINYHLSRCTPMRMLHELGQVGNTHGLSSEEELNAYYSERLKFVPQAQALYNSKSCL